MIRRRALPPLLASLLVAACGGGDGAGGGGRGGPDLAATQQKLLASVNLVVEGNARFSKFAEKSRKSEGGGGMESLMVTFEGEIEFTGDCYYGDKERKKGDRVPFDAEVEYLRDGDGWKQLIMGLDLR